MKMVSIGIDPGKSGACAIIFETGAVHIIPFDEREYAEELRYVHLSGEACVCALERVNAMPGQGVTSMFSFGTNYGFIQGLLTANEIPYELVLPRKWKAEFGLTGDKQSSVEVAQRLFPKVKLLRTDRCRKPDDGMAEALLLAEYARRKLGGVAR